MGAQRSGRIRGLRGRGRLGAGRDLPGDANAAIMLQPQDTAKSAPWSLAVGGAGAVVHSTHHRLVGQLAAAGQNAHHCQFISNSACPDRPHAGADTADGRLLGGRLRIQEMVQRGVRAAPAPDVPRHGRHELPAAPRRRRRRRGAGGRWRRLTARVAGLSRKRRASGGGDCKAAAWLAFVAARSRGAGAQCMQRMVGE